MEKKTKIKIILVVIFIILTYCSVWYFKFAKHYPSNISLVARQGYWGLTFSRKFSEEMKQNWKDVYISILDDLNAKDIRIPIYWDDIEKSDGVFDFSDYDYMFDEGSYRDVKFIANVGWRLPRWPECHAPTFMRGKEVGNYQSKVLKVIEVTVNRYKDRNEIIAWQVENEPFLDTFGVCPKSDEEFLKKEVSLVRSLDSRPIIISGSGELSSWKKEAKIGDIFGTTMYRVVWNPVFGYFRYPIPDWFYKFKGKLMGLDEDRIIVSELQAEPWVPKGTLADLSFKEADKSFDMDQFKANLQYAIDTKLNKVYLWGVEWWYYQKSIGNPEYWDLAKNIFYREDPNKRELVKIKSKLFKPETKIRLKKTS